MESSNKIVIIGIGNLLLKDEGVGIHAVNRLSERYRFSDNVELYDGGTLGNRLLIAIERAKILIVIDAMINGSPPGTMFKMQLSTVKETLPPKHSVHQSTFMETLANADFLGMLPTETIVYGIEPKDIQSLEIGLSDDVSKQFERLLDRILEEVVHQGGLYWPIKPHDHNYPIAE